MNIMLGNLTVSQIEKRLGIDFPHEIRDFMNISHEPTASNIPKGKWHCFDIPFCLVCGDVETATKIFNSVKEKSGEIKERLQISLSNN
ncbi:hypothetical protein KRE49_11690 [Elizabethkingia meningoseptica]|uniref:hypothetical protein n=1 Tax=Elizabethkingia meningoseptica TaxID=238 RepID=UPI0023AF4412|nr:hypothetical protein [Elizabethkingia meningoseptica]MDE5516401.1 hypothetical protein [Elizabethkingia meningoseptica]MDE5526646.1 hypothetical protein [Elizabethkingia meningoseptica]MDN4033741.1 hypothetical protein [Elizabethkingia meningoseptica]